MIVDSDQIVRLGRIVVTHLQDSKAVTVRRYKQLSTGSPMLEYELIAVNENWASIRVTQNCIHKIIGAFLAMIRKI